VLAAFFVLAAGAGLVGLALVDWRTVPPTAGTCALILTIAALGVAMYR
jgi:preprotein translocase subunit SecD